MTDTRAAPRGIYAATPCPLTVEHGVDEAALTALARWLAAVPGIVGFLLNGHAGENTTMPLADQHRVASVMRRAAPRGYLVAGVNAENSAVAAAHAAALETAGADALMVFPPNGWALYQETGMVVAHHRAILEATTRPVMLYQASINAGRMAYPPETLSALVSLPRVVGIKDGSWEVATYEQNRRLVQARAPAVATFGSGDEHLLTSYAIGSEGSLVSLAAVAPEAVVAVFAAIERGDLAGARAAHERLYPLSRAIYRDAPGGRANARLKTCLALMGRFESDRMVPPVSSTPREEHAGLRAALALAGCTVVG
ncbi:MAG: dihydrodipicolinate synthase family protein [Pseudomonadota bacterium]